MSNIYDSVPVFENDRWLLRFVEKTDALLVAKDGVAFNGYWVYKSRG